MDSKHVRVRPLRAFLHCYESVSHLQALSCRDLRRLPEHVSRTSADHAKRPREEEKFISHLFVLSVRHPTVCRRRASHPPKHCLRPPVRTYALARSLPL